MKRRILGGSLYALMYISTSLFISSSVLMQTAYNLFLIVGLITFHYDQKPEKTEYKFLNNIIISFWIFQGGLFLYNLRYWNKDVQTWFFYFNRYDVLIPVYLASLFTGIIYSFIWTKRK